MDPKEEEKHGVAFLVLGIHFPGSAGSCYRTLSTAVLSSTMAETLRMSELVVNIVAPPEREDREE